MNFESELAKGEFCIPECSVCKKIVWPPAEFCNHCFGSVHLRKGEFEGKIIEFAKKNDEYFCLVEFENTVRIIAKSLHLPKNYEMVKISECGMTDGNYFFYVS